MYIIIHLVIIIIYKEKNEVEASKCNRTQKTFTFNIGFIIIFSQSRALNIKDINLEKGIIILWKC